MRIRSWAVSGAIVLAGLLSQPEKASAQITQPATTDVWDENSVSKNIVFGHAGGSVHTYAIWIDRINNGSNAFYASHGPPSANPETYTLTAPDVGNDPAGTLVPVKITIKTTDTMGVVTTYTRTFTIRTT